MTSTTPSIADYLEAANAVYTRGNKSGEIIPRDLTPLRDACGELVVSREDQLKDGFYAQAFLDKDKHVIVAFEGTVPNASDYGTGTIRADVAIANSQRPPVFQHAVDFMNSQVVPAARAHDITPGNIFVTGHSLGGAEAEHVAGSVPGLGGGITFAAPGIVSSGLNMSARVTNIEVYGDPVGNLGTDTPDGASYTPMGVKHVGQVVMVGSPQRGQMLRAEGQFYARGLHMLKSSISSLNVAATIPALSMMVAGIELTATTQGSLHALGNTYAQNLGYHLAENGGATPNQSATVTRVSAPSQAVNTPSDDKAIPLRRIPNLGHIR